MSETVLYFEPGVFESGKRIKKWGREWRLHYTRVNDNMLMLFSNLDENDLHPYEVHVSSQVYRDGRNKVWFICARHWGRNFASKCHDRIYNGYISYIPYDDFFEFLLLN